MDSSIIFTKNLSGTIDTVLGINNNTLITTPRNLGQLADIDVSGVVPNHSLIYNTVTGKWEATYPALINCQDVSFNNLSSSNVVKWNSATSRWINRDLDYSVISISGKLKDNIVGSNVEFNLLNETNYTTFNITASNNNGISIDTNNSVSGFTSGRNYKIESCISYNVAVFPTTDVGAFVSVIKNAGVGINTVTFSFPQPARNYVINNSIVNNALSSVSYFGRYPFAITGVSGFDVNITLTVIEI
jgi:hypothetical protein